LAIMDGYLELITLTLKVMLRLNKSISIILFSICWVSCDIMEKDKMHLISQISKETVSEKVYYDVYNNAIDSIRFWTENSLKAYLYEKGNNWLIDSVLCFNSQNDKCIMALLNQDQYPTSRNDGINFFYGVNINGKWYFFKGPFIVL